MNRQRQSLKIAEIIPISQWVKCFRFVEASGGALASFYPGQYLNLFYSIDGAVTSRPYSIASSPREAEQGYYDLYIHGGGPFTSNWLFRNAHVGMEISSSMPEGTFCLNPAKDTGKVIGISGGMSITPLRAMARAVADGTLDIDLTLFCGWDCLEDVLYFEEFRALAEQTPRFHAVFLLKDENVPGYEQGFVTLELIRKYTDPTGAAFFMCGPAEMYASLARELKPLNIPAHRYHIEIPGAVSAGFPGTEQVLRGQVLTLKGQLWGETFSIPMRSDEPVLVALERAGMNADARCRSGHCGYCAAKLISGQVFVPERWEKMRPEGEPEGIFHPCCSFPLSDLEIFAE